MKRIGLLSVPEVQLPKVQSLVTATKISLRTYSMRSVHCGLVRYRFLTFQNWRGPKNHYTFSLNRMKSFEMFLEHNADFSLILYSYSISIRVK